MRSCASVGTIPASSSSSRAAEYFAAHPPAFARLVRPSTVLMPSSVGVAIGPAPAAVAACAAEAGFAGREARRACPGRRAEGGPVGTMGSPRFLCKDRRMPSALITGGSSGIGLAIARCSARRGTRSRSRPEGRAARGRRRRAGGDRDLVDVRNEEDCARLVATHVEAHGGLDVLVNSAGVGIAGRIGDMETKPSTSSCRQPSRRVPRHARGAAGAARGARLRREPRVDRRDDPHARARGLRRGEGGADLAHAARSHARRRTPACASRRSAPRSSTRR